jgi:hypothetical protein
MNPASTLSGCAHPVQKFSFSRISKLNHQLSLWTYAKSAYLGHVDKPRYSQGNQTVPPEIDHPERQITNQRRRLTANRKSESLSASRRAAHLLHEFMTGRPLGEKVEKYDRRIWRAMCPGAVAIAADKVSRLGWQTSMAFAVASARRAAASRSSA